MSRSKVLLAGESWVSTATHIKGFDQFPTVTYHQGADELLKALKDSPFDIEFMPAHQAQRDFPQTIEALRAYDAVILSDIGANTLLLHPDTWIHSKTTPNRLKLLRQYVEEGGALLMFGGYYSFQGINGGARYARTPVEDVLPVTCFRFDDRVEVPEGFTPEVTGDAAHPILQGLGTEWPVLLGYNEVELKPGAEVLATVSGEYGSQPLLVTGTYGKGRSVVWTSDVGPHWLPSGFIAWEGYAKLFAAMLAWSIAKD
ncbi:MULTISPECIES: glutamine amidotransferase [unclassified Aureimonas]|uniref:glutamine amidotransferase n=1 Tax=unclassified Aureimonas TaxID=2615206 RepID=UPI0006FBAC73|nr:MULTISPECIES: glutamine amidotransferase [unclassified Aureimonas]KQT69829.1 cytoplasmic protein [Aureimonas sp. Leaf427]KQT76019.1 cytoplasmic protein [Aureimonas sp. Leaf460]